MRRMGLTHAVLGFCASWPSSSGEKKISVIDADAPGVTLLSASASIESGMTGAAVALSVGFAARVDVEAGAAWVGVRVGLAGNGVTVGALVACAGTANGRPGWYTIDPTKNKAIAAPTSHQPATTRSRRWRK